MLTSKRKAFDNGEIDAEGKPRFQGFEGFRGQPGGGAAPGGSHFESFHFGNDGFQRAGGSGGGGGFEDILRNMFGGAARRCARFRARVSSRRISSHPAPARICTPR